MSQRHEFVMLFEQEGVNRRELCRRFGVSPTIGYRLLARWRADGKAGLANRSRRPQESLVLAMRDGTVQSEPSAIFRRYRLPERMLMDNGAPWGSDAAHRHTWLTVWLLELGVAVSHGRPYHLQTRGKRLPQRRLGTSGFTVP